MSDALGLSIGTANLVAVCGNRPPVSRRAVLTVFPHRAPVVGARSENPDLNGSGLELTGFVDRVGDPVPLVAADGSTHRADQLVAEAVSAMTQAVGDAGRPSGVAIAVPSHWGAGALAALRAALRDKPHLSSSGVAAPLVSDTSTALTALAGNPGLPEHGVVALLDFGAGGTSITLADADNYLTPIGQTVRLTDFSGDQIDQSVLVHVLADISGARDIDPASTAAVGSLSRLRDQCRHAKERLSSETVTVIHAQLPGYRADIRLTRAELEALIDVSLTGVADELEEVLLANGVGKTALTAVATVGGGAAIPLMTERLSERLRVPVVTTPRPQLSMAVGAALIAARGPASDVPTSMATAARMRVGAPTTSTPAVTSDPPASAGTASAAFPSLAWSEDDATEEPVPYRGRADHYRVVTGRTGSTAGRSTRGRVQAARLAAARRRRAGLIFAVVAGLFAVAATGGLAYTLMTKDSGISPAQTTVPAADAIPADAPPR